jgi:Flp pilus assembly protein protease CpaA
VFDFNLINFILNNFDLTNFFSLGFFQILVIFIGVSISAYTDFKKGYIYDYITYPMIILGLFGALGMAFFGNYFNLFSGVVVFVLMYLAYRTGKTGGGDVKLFLAITLLNPTGEFYFLFTLIFFACVSAIIFYSIYYSAKIIPQKWVILFSKKNSEGLKNAVMLGLSVSLYCFALSYSGIARTQTILFMGFIGVAGMLFALIQKQLILTQFEKKIKLSEMEEDEIVSTTNNKKILQIMNKQILAGKTQINALKRAGIKQIIVAHNLPKFGPFILIGVLIAILEPKAIVWLF